MEPDVFSDARSGVLPCEEMTTGELRDLLARYPYFQTARLLLLERLWRDKDPSFRRELQRASLFAPDRSVLFYMVEGGKYSLDAASPPPEKTGEDTKRNGADRTSVIINDFLEAVPDSQPRRRITLTEAATDYTAYLEQQEEEEEQESRSGRSSPPPGDGSLPRLKAKEDRQEQAPPHGASGGRQSPEGGRPAPQENGGEEGFFTGTLAKIYIKQGKYEHAIEIMRRLEADFPKKSSYFADQIRFLEKAVINNKNKSKECTQ